MSSKHTPGPWWIEKDGSAENNNEVNVVNGADGTMIVYGQANDADARLIAAAPDLLKVLRMARAKIAAELQVMVMSHTGPDGLIDDAAVVLLIEAEQDLVNQIDAAIAKAEGAA